MCNRVLIVSAVLSIGLSAMALDVTAQPLPRIVVSGLKAPGRMLPLESGPVLVAENGNGPNTGRVSVVTPDGGRLTLIDGLPAGLSAPNNEPSGPAALALKNRTLFIAIGKGDSGMTGPVAGTEVPNPTPSSPLFSAVLALDLDRSPEVSGGQFLFTPADHVSLAGGKPVALLNRNGETAILRLVVDIPDHLANPRPDVPSNVRVSNPFGLELADSCGLWLVDAGRNLIWRVDICASTYAAAVSFPPFANPLLTGPALLDAVPTSARAYEGALLVTFLTGQPFPPLLAEVRLVKPESGESAVLFKGLHMLIDALPFEQWSDGFFVLEYSQNAAAGAPGRVFWFDSPLTAPVVLSDQVMGPTHMAIAPGANELWVCENRTGRIVAIAVPR